MAKKTISIRDIARMAGVSTATVSKVLNGKGSISDATRRRVEEIALKEGYVANYAAKTLRAAHTRTVGIVTPDVSNEFFSSIVLGLETILYDEGYTCYICNTHGDAKREQNCLHSLTQRQVDGIVLVGGRHEPDWGAMPEQTPVTCIDRSFGAPRSDVSYVGNDWPGIVRDSVRTLLQRGCRRIAYLSVTGASISLEENPFFQAYAETIAEAGIVLDRNLVLQGPHHKESMLEAQDLVSRCLDDGWAPDAVFAVGDRLALGAITALREHGLAIGDDVRVIGVDDSQSARIASPALSSVNRHTDELSRSGAEALLSMMHGESHPRNITIHHEVVERASTLGSRSAR